MKKKFGYMPCPDCGERVTVRISETETLSYHCDECDGNGYSKKAEARYAAWVKRIQRTPGAPEQKPDPKPSKEAPDKPARKSIMDEIL